MITLKSATLHIRTQLVRTWYETLRILDFYISFWAQAQAQSRDLFTFNF